MSSVRVSYGVVRNRTKDATGQERVIVDRETHIFHSMGASSAFQSICDMVQSKPHDYVDLVVERFIPSGPPRPVRP